MTDLIVQNQLGNNNWDDAGFTINAVKLDSVNPPTETAYKGGLVLEFPTSANKKIYFTVQLPHGYKKGSNIEFHIHYALSQAGAGTGAENVKWNFTYSWSNINGDIPDATTEPVTIDVQALTTAKHYIADIVASITGTGKDISSILICSLERDVSVANDYGGSVYLLSADFHILKDSLGSNNETSKG